MSDEFVHDEDWESTWVEASEWSPTISEGNATWTTGIYQIERTDPLMGGEYGVSNVQARQLAKRTQYLLASFLANHKSDGKHDLYDANIADGEKIAESKFAFDDDLTSTSLYEKVQEQASTLATLEKYLVSSLYGDTSSVHAVYDALLLSWEYSRSGFDFCLFTDAFTFESDAPNIPVNRTVNQDDSIDVTLDSDEAIAALVENSTWMLVDPTTETYKEVVISQVLEQDPDDGTWRVLLDEALGFSVSSDDGAYLTKSTWAMGDMEAAVDYGAVLITRLIECLQYYSQGRMSIAHNTEGTEFSVYYKFALDDDWIQAEQLSSSVYQEKYEYYLSTWELPGDEPFYLKIVAHGDDTIDHIAVYVSVDDIQINYVRKPVGTAELTISRYGALYEDPVAQLEMQIKTEDDDEYTEITPYLTDIDTTPTSFSLEDYVTENYGELTDGVTYTWRARYVSERGHYSSYCTPVTFTRGA